MLPIFFNSPHGTLELDVKSPSHRLPLAGICSSKVLSEVLIQVCCAGLLQVKVAVLKHFSNSQAQRLSCFRECQSVSEV